MTKPFINWITEIVHSLNRFARNRSDCHTERAALNRYMENRCSQQIDKVCRGADAEAMGLAID